MGIRGRIAMAGISSRARGVQVAAFILACTAAADDEQCASGTPPRVDITDIQGIAAALNSHGYAVLANLTTNDDGASQVDWKQVALSLPERVFAGRLLSSGSSTLSGVHEENYKMAEKTKRLRDECLASGECDAQGSWSSNFSIGGMPLLPHTDGYVYGDYLPDIVFLLAESHAELGGHNFIVDGESVLQRLQQDSEHPEAYEIAHRANVDLTERLSAGGITTGREAFGTIFRRRPDGGIWWRRQLQTCAYEQGMEKLSEGAPYTIKTAAQPYQSLWRPAGPEAEEASTRAMLHTVDAAIQTETLHAPRFMLSTGEALVIDNYRVLHGREGYSSHGFESDRKIWRLWCWTNRSSGLPAGVAEFGSPLDAEAMV